MTRKELRKTIYLAGPVSNCNARQIHAWRDEIKARWGRAFDFIDPTGFIDGDASPDGIVRKDLEAIRRCDALVANMWRESIGTAIGVAQATRHGKPVVVIDANGIQSRALSFYAIAVVDDVKSAMAILSDYFKSQQRLKRVIKHGGNEEPFDIIKVFRALQDMCRRMRQDDLLAPREVVAKVVPRLMQAEKSIPGVGVLTSTAIRDAITDVLASMSSGRDDSESFARILEEWRRSGRSRTVVPHGGAGAGAIGQQPRRVRVFGGKAHASIWGKAVKSLGAIPVDARKAFAEMLRVKGIAEIRLTKKSTTKTKWTAGVRVELFDSTTPHLIEGKLYDKGRAGRVQMFQILLQDPAAKDEIAAALREVLGAGGYLREDEKSG